MLKQEKMNRFTKKYAEAFKQPIIQNFLKNPNNNKIFMNYIQNPKSKCYIEELDQSFKIFYKKAKIGRYLDNLIHFYSIDYDKKMRKINSRFLLTLNGSGKESTDNGLIEKLDKYCNEDEKTVMELIISNSEGLQDQIENEFLHKALLKLTPKQQCIIELIYVRGLSNIEIAEYFDDSPQNISAIHKRALKKLKEEYSQTLE
ncbi:sigma-70 family RNA polymerase sigma factor [Bacillus sp. MMSF_3353]|uniref:sigma-70 family RNA polymerase sigma factor n=1 Tax=Bacillus sp. MMSF_3353 TaxID=3047081 RepID=UPI00273E5251|nr:sigma-70 family RNA polymerase sigma factor [Bacillus sp. MMSF_3353]